MSKSNPTHIILITFFLLLIAFAYQSIMTGMEAGFKDADRLFVYVLRGALLALLLAYNLIRSKRHIRWTALSKVLWGILIWMILVNLANKADLWYSLNHISVAFLWIMLYYFFYSYPANNPDSVKMTKIGAVVMLLFYVWANTFAHNNIQANFDRENAVVGLSYVCIMLSPVSDC